MKYKKFRYIFVFFAVCTACLLSACSKGGKDEAVNDSSLPELRIGVDILEPFFYVDKNGNYTGIDAQLAREACKRAGYEPVFVELQWSNNDEYLDNGSIDCIWTASAIDGQENDYLWTESYLESSIGIVVQQNSPCRTTDELTRYSVAVRNNSKAEELFLDNVIPCSSLYTCGTNSIARTAFIKSYADCLVDHKIVLMQLVNDNPELYRFLDTELPTLHLGVAFKKDSTDGYMEKIDAALRQMRSDGTVSSIVEKYCTNTDEMEELMTDGR